MPKNEGGPKQYTWSEMQLLSEIERLKDYIKNDPKQSFYPITEQQAEEAKLKLVELEKELTLLYEERKNIRKT